MAGEHFLVGEGVCPPLQRRGNTNDDEDGEGCCRPRMMTTTTMATKPLAMTMTLRDGGGTEESQHNPVLSIFYHHTALAFVGDTVLATLSWLDG